MQNYSYEKVCYTRKRSGSSFFFSRTNYYNEITHSLTLWANDRRISLFAALVEPSFFSFSFFFQNWQFYCQGHEISISNLHFYGYLIGFSVFFRLQNAGGSKALGHRQKSASRICLWIHFREINGIHPFIFIIILEWLK